MTQPVSPDPAEIARIAEGLTEGAETRRDLLDRWDSLCDADPLDCDHDAYIERMEASGFMEWAPVDRDALEESFAAERGIYPGGMMFSLTPLGLAVRAHLEAKS